MEGALSEAREAVVEWRAVRGMPAPKLPRGEPIRTTRAELRIAYERRTFEADSEPAPQGAAFSGPSEKPDPWSFEVPDAPRNGSAWSERRPLPEHRSVEACPVCRGARRFTCDDCEGRGYKVEHDYDPITGVRVTRTFVCGTCAGAKSVPCGGCRGTALVRVTPVLVTETSTESRRSVMHDGALPDELVSEMRGSPSLSLFEEKVIHRAEGSALPADPWGGSRAPAGISPRVVEEIARLVAEPLPDDRRACGWRLEIVEGYVVSFATGDRRIHVWGSPRRVSGDDDPVTRSHSTLVLVALGVLALGAAGAIALLLT